MMVRKIGSGLTGAGGVALADILANSVAVLLILIFLSISVKQEQAEQQVEQTVDISILMARKLADSVVLNALPNSRPAYLHDYHSCTIRHDCEPYLYPIIEIYDTFTRIFNTNQVLDRAAMLAQTNALDEYLLGLDSDQLNNIRVDIYGVGMFYLTVSTLREYKAPLNHWHFLGEKAPGPASTQQQGESNNLLAQLLEQGAEGLSDHYENPDELPGQSHLPTGVNIVDPGQVARLEEENLLLPPEDINVGTGAQTDQQPSNLLSELLEGFSQSRDPTNNNNQQELATSGNMRYQLRLPNVKPPKNATPVELDLDQDQIRMLMLTFLFMAMEDARKNNYFDPAELSKLFVTLVSHPESYRQYEYFSLVRDIDATLSQLSEHPAKKVGIHYTGRQSNNPVDLLLSPNSAIQPIVFSGGTLFKGQDELISGGTGQVDMLMRLYPFVYRGDRTGISSDMVMLMHPEEFSLRGSRWYPIALVNHDLQQMTLGFVYGSFSSGKFMMPVDVNQIRAQSVILQSDFGQPPRRFPWQIAIAFVISGLIVLFIVVTIIRSSLSDRRSSV